MFDDNSESSFGALLTEVKNQGEDFEWYPTTDEILERVATSIEENFRHYGSGSLSILDIGAGDGKALRFLSKRTPASTLLAIEKSQRLIRELDESIILVGTDFLTQRLVTKEADITFCNPPYKKYADWSAKIIRETRSRIVYLVIPRRWKDNPIIAEALEFRNAEADVIGSFDFLNAQEREARASVDILSIKFHDDRDAFFKNFVAEFGIKQSEPTDTREQEKKPFPPFGELVIGPSYPVAMVELYEKELAKIQKNYLAALSLDQALLLELGCSVPRICELLKERLNGLSTHFWQELLAQSSAITDRLTSRGRDELLRKLQSTCQLDFTLDNILGVIIWLINASNKRIDKQFLETYQTLINKANVINYKSNKRTFVDNRWRYMHHDENPNSHFALDYRIVSHSIGGCAPDWPSSTNRLSERAAQFIGDLLTVARNMGYVVTTNDNRLSYSGRNLWAPGQSESFSFLKNDKKLTLFEVKAFKNGNCHFRFDKQFMLKMNVTFGRLAGWLRSPAQAAEELDDPLAAKEFNCVGYLCPANVPLLPSGTADDSLPQDPC